MTGGHRLRQAALADVRQAHLQTAGEQGLNVLSKTAMLRGRGASSRALRERLRTTRVNRLRHTPPGRPVTAVQDGMGPQLFFPIRTDGAVEARRGKACRSAIGSKAASSGTLEPSSRSR